jgi:hypothetical protein
VPITEMRFGRSTLALDSWRLKPAKISAFLPQGRKAVFGLRTRAGLRIRATANHPFRTPGGWAALSDLRPGDSIAAAREVPVFGKTPIPDREATQHGLNAGAGDEFIPQAVFMAPENSVRLFLQALFSGNGGVYDSEESVFVEYSSNSRRLIEDVHHLLLRFGILSSILEMITANGTAACRIQISDMDQIRRFAERVGFMPGSVKQGRLDTALSDVIDAQPSAGQSVRCHADARVAPATGDLYVGPRADGPVWDVVECIEPKGTEEVFDISVPGPHNFLANDLIVHNSTYARCGVIVNVTPLEPEWEGHVTLEFSNTTPLPAKIYANEGVAQMLFFESDEVCETSYADRGGKYQGQRGVTLPKA